MEHVMKFLATEATPKDFYEVATCAQTQLIALMSNVPNPKADELAHFFEFSLHLMKAIENDIAQNE